MMINRPFHLINGNGLRHDCNPSVASLRLYSHPRNGYPHCAGTHHSLRRNTHLVAIHHPDDYDPSAEDEAMSRDIDALKHEMVAAGVRIFVGGLSPAQC